MIHFSMLSCFCLQVSGCVLSTGFSSSSTFGKVWKFHKGASREENRWETCLVVKRRKMRSPLPPCHCRPPMSHYPRKFATTLSPPFPLSLLVTICTFFSYQSSNRKIKKCVTDRRTERPSYRDARTHLRLEDDDSDATGGTYGRRTALQTNSMVFSICYDLLHGNRVFSCTVESRYNASLGFYPW